MIPLDSTRPASNSADLEEAFEQLAAITQEIEARQPVILEKMRIALKESRDALDSAMILWKALV